MANYQTKNLSDRRFAYLVGEGAAFGGLPPTTFD
jgi:hypothetical protein